MARMRDLIGHHYYKLDPQIVRATIGAPVERLRAACKAILAEPVGEAEDNELAGLEATWTFGEMLGVRGWTPHASELWGSLIVCQSSPRTTAESRSPSTLFRVVDMTATYQRCRTASRAVRCGS
jgi:hypothetical protein